jgi:arylsulfatase A-like enzyme
VIVAAVGCNESLEIPEPQPNLVLITVDTLRADHLGCYGHGRATSPRIDALASTGLLFERAISSAPWTLPSIASVHTSLYPREHGANGVNLPMRNELMTLAEALQDVGYDTTAVVTHAFVGRRYNFDQGFATFDDELVRGHEAVTSVEVTESALRHLRRKRREPFFLWVHYFDPHFTYVRHPEFGFALGPPNRVPDRLRAGELKRAAEAMADDSVPDPFSLNTVAAVYDEEVAFTDAAIGRLNKGIERMSLHRPTIAALTADHGEYFMERGRFGHGRDVYDELVHVPLIFWGDIDEALKGRRFSGTVEPRSLARTFAELGRVEGDPFGGRNLLTLTSSSKGNEPTFSEGSHAWGSDDRKIMVEWKRQKLIHFLDEDRFELYDLDRDPREQVDLWSQDGNSASARELKQELARFSKKDIFTPAAIELTQEEIERLESLGYVQ